MRLLSVCGALALIPTVISSPVTGFKLATRDDSRGNETISGLGARKQAVTGAGGNTRDLAIAMLETKTMTADYTYGMTINVSRKIRCVVCILTYLWTGDGKTGDSTNFGIFKQNWYMLRHSASEFLGETVDQVDDGAILKCVSKICFCS